MRTLYIDTHLNDLNIILFEDKNIVKEEHIINERNNSTLLMPSIAKVIDNESYDEILVINGPGSFTGERIATTIGKTIAYCLSVPIKVIDSLTVMAINVVDIMKYVSLPDRNGAFLGVFDKNNKRLENFVYLNKSNYDEFVSKHNVISNVDIDYEKVYDFTKKIKPMNPHEVKPLYVKGISALDGK